MLCLSLFFPAQLYLEFLCICMPSKKARFHDQVLRDYTVLYAWYLDGVDSIRLSPTEHANGHAYAFCIAVSTVAQWRHLQRDMQTGHTKKMEVGRRCKLDDVSLHTKKMEVGRRCKLDDVSLPCIYRMATYFIIFTLLFLSPKYCSTWSSTFTPTFA
jgi:hypothetical protein